MIHQYLFFIDNQNVSSYKYDNGKFQLIRYKGEDFCSTYDSSYWKWWEESTSFIDSEDYVDFCFVGQDIADQYSNYQTVEASSWDMETIKCFFSEYIKESNINLLCINKGTNKVMRISLVPKTYKYEKNVQFKYFTVPAQTLDVGSEKSQHLQQTNSRGLRDYYLRQLK